MRVKVPVCTPLNRGHIHEAYSLRRACSFFVRRVARGRLRGEPAATSRPCRNNAHADPDAASTIRSRDHSRRRDRARHHACGHPVRTRASRW